MLRRAFVVGNRTYESDDYCDLPGVSNDVEIIRQALSQIGFAEIVEYCNLSSEDFGEYLTEFAQYAPISDEDVNLIYYSGHGQVCSNQLGIVTVEEDSTDIFTIEEILERFEGNPSQLVIVLDMCRTGGIDTLPSERTHDHNVALVYATSADMPSQMNSESAFTKYFAKNLLQVGGNISSIVTRTREEMNAAGIHQTPALYQSVSADVVLNPLFLDKEWFSRQNKMAIESLGRRYCPEVNVFVGLEEYFDAVSFSDAFVERITQEFHECLAEYDTESNNLKDNSTSEVQKIVQGFSRLHEAVSLYVTSLSVEMESRNELSAKVLSLVSELQQYCESFLHSETNENKAIDAIYAIRSALYAIEEVMENRRIRMAFSPCIFLHGEGGIGKSHSIAHFVAEREKAGMPSVLLLGQTFTEGMDPRERIMDSLQLQCSFDTLLSYLNEYGKAAQSRVVICLDALNEGLGQPLWCAHLAQLIQNVTDYPWLALIISARTYSFEELKRKNALPDGKVQAVKHRGFRNVSHTAINTYFEHYEVSCDPTVMLQREFSKPLFLRLFCETYAHQSVAAGSVTIDNVFSNYIATVNDSIAEKCEYSRYINVVEKYILAIQKMKIDEIRRNPDQRVVLTEDCYIDTAMELARTYNINKDLLSALIHEDILTVVAHSHQRNTFHITYERIEDYHLAQLIYTDYSDEQSLSQQMEAYLLSNAEVLREFITYAANQGVLEVSDYLEITDESSDVILGAFIDSLAWRTPNAYTQKTKDIIERFIVTEDTLWSNLWDVMISLSAMNNHPFSGGNIHQYMKSLSTAERDAVFIPLWDQLVDRTGTLTDGLLGLMENNKLCAKIGRTSAINMAKCVCWFLITSNNRVRDRATYALRALFLHYPTIITEILNSIHNADDPYVYERVLAAALGCITIKEKPDLTKSVAAWVYSNVFESANITPNIMIRDYARCIVEYARAHLPQADYPLLTRKFYSSFPQVPSDDVVASYEGKLGYHIFHSMRVEYNRDGSHCMYGDFGRYTFQSFFRPWNRMLNCVDLMNIALQNILDRGYDKGKHGDYDMTCRFDRGGRDDARERIGKKYQWLALYDLASSVIDYYGWPKADSYFFQYTSDEEIMLRNFDPTLMRWPVPDKQRKRIHTEKYKFQQQFSDTWHYDYSDFDLEHLERFVSIQIKGRSFALLKGYYNWSEPKAFGYDISKHPRRNVYMFVNLYLIKKTRVKMIIGQLMKADLMGRWMPESNETYRVFSRERYWSKLYANAQVNPWRSPNQNKIHDLMFIPYTGYSSGGFSDTMESHGDYTYPIEELVHFLALKSTTANSVMVNHDNKIISFDSSELLREDIGLYFDLNELMRYADHNDLVPIWTVLSEKSIAGVALHEGQLGAHVSGVCYIDDDGTIRSMCRMICD